MPIQKFRTLEEASLALRTVPGSDANVSRLRFSYSFWSRVNPRVVTRGVRKYRSAEAAEADADGKSHLQDSIAGR